MKQNEISKKIQVSNKIQINNETNNININEDYRNIKGSITKIEDERIIVLDEVGNRNEIAQKEFINLRTRDIINIYDISVGDYYKYGEIIRNISSDELKKELLLNLSRTFNSSKLSTKTIRLKRLEKFDRICKI